MNNPLISIIIPCFNRENFIAQTLDSCLEQSYQNIEIIVVNDGSQDKTGEILKEYSARYQNIQVVETKNQGQCTARNLGLELSKGTFIKFLDSDDLLLPYSIESQLKTLQDNQVKITVSGVVGFKTDELGILRKQLLKSQINTSDAKTTLPLFIDLLREYPFTYNEVLIHREIVLGVSGFNEKLKAAEEGNLNLKIASRYPNIVVAFDREVLLMKRIGYNSLSVRVKQQDIPYCLLSLQDASKYYLESDRINNTLSKYISDNLYRFTIYAYRNFQVQYFKQALLQWKLHENKFPKLSPWYHHYLHSIFGFEVAESILMNIRKILSFLKGNRVSIER